MTETLRVASDDILYRLRAEERERKEALNRARAAAYGYSTREDDHVHTLVRDAASEIILLRLKLKEAGIDYRPVSDSQ
jgi:hypothetical protein